MLQSSLYNGEFVSDLKHLKENIADNLKELIPSHDTVEYAFQELKVQHTIIKTKDNITHEINENKMLNDLILGICVNLGLLKSDEKNDVLDFDKVVLENQKQDAKTSYKITKAYPPCFANIGNCTVYFETRNGGLMTICSNIFEWMKQISAKKTKKKELKFSNVQNEFPCNTSVFVPNL